MQRLSGGKLDAVGVTFSAVNRFDRLLPVCPARQLDDKHSSGSVSLLRVYPDGWAASHSRQAQRYDKFGLSRRVSMGGNRCSLATRSAPPRFRQADDKPSSGVQDCEHSEHDKENGFVHADEVGRRAAANNAIKRRGGLVYVLT
jgi:hypothetical protein